MHTSGSTLGRNAGDCYNCYRRHPLTIIAHRELRNNSSRILERVRNGETIDVTNNGESTATLIPPPSSALDKLIRAGRVRVAVAAGEVDFSKIRRVTSSETTAEILADLRGAR